MACTWFGEIPSCCSLTLLLGPACFLLKYVLQTIFSGPVDNVVIMMILFNLVDELHCGRVLLSFSNICSLGNVEVTAATPILQQICVVKFLSNLVANETIICCVAQLPISISRMDLQYKWIPVAK